VDPLKGQYYLVGNYGDQCTGWTTLQPKRDQVVLEFTNIFHTLPTKLGIRDSKWHLVLKYHGCLHKYIQTEMEFLDISSLGAAYRYAVKIKQKFKQRNRQEFGYVNALQWKMGKCTPNRQTKGPSKNNQQSENLSKSQTKKGYGKTKKDTSKWCNFHKSP
jgi:hypothetical protein